MESGGRDRGSGIGDGGQDQIMKIRNYRDLHVWQKSMELVIECYRIAGQFPKHEIYGLSSQLRRAVVSVAARECQKAEDFQIAPKVV